MASKVPDYHRGEMDVHMQLDTYHRVMAMTKWGSLVTGDAILFLVLWFCTGAGFMGALITGVIVAAIGVFLLRGGGEH
jgi:multisubunit Na+/H+ antiporter MnhG subunit